MLKVCFVVIGIVNAEDRKRATALLDKILEDNEYLNSPQSIELFEVIKYFYQVNHQFDTLIGHGKDIL